MITCLNRFFEEFFNELLNEKQLIEYLHDIEQILFDSNADEKSIFDKDEMEFFTFTQNLLNNLLPGKRDFKFLSFLFYLPSFFYLYFHIITFICFLRFGTKVYRERKI